MQRFLSFLFLHLTTNRKSGGCFGLYHHTHTEDVTVTLFCVYDAVVVVVSLMLFLFLSLSPLEIVIIFVVRWVPSGQFQFSSTKKWERTNNLKKKVDRPTRHFSLVLLFLCWCVESSILLFFHCEAKKKTIWEKWKVEPSFFACWRCWGQLRGGTSTKKRREKKERKGKSKAKPTEAAAGQLRLLYIKERRYVLLSSCRELFCFLRCVVVLWCFYLSPLSLSLFCCSYFIVRRAILCFFLFFVLVAFSCVSFEKKVNTQDKRRTRRRQKETEQGNRKPPIQKKNQKQKKKKEIFRCLNSMKRKPFNDSVVCLFFQK